MNAITIDQHIIHLLQRYFSTAKGRAVHGDNLVKLLTDRFGLYASAPLTLRECALNADRSHEWVRGNIVKLKAGIAGFYSKEELSPIQDVIDYMTPYTPIHEDQANMVLKGSRFARGGVTLTIESLSLIADFFGLAFNMEILAEERVVVGLGGDERRIVDKMMRYLIAEVKRIGYADVVSLSEKIAPATSHHAKHVARIITSLSSSYKSVSMIEKGIVSLKTGKSPIYLMAKKLFSLKGELHENVLWAAWQQKGMGSGLLSKKGLVNAILLHDEFVLKGSQVIRRDGVSPKETLTEYEQLIVKVLEGVDDISLKEAMAEADAAGLKSKTMACVFKKMPFLIRRLDNRWCLVTSDRDYESKFIPIENKQSVFNQYRVESDFILITFNYTQKPIVSVLPGVMKTLLNNYPDDFSCPINKKIVSLTRKNSYFIKGLSNYLRDQPFAEGDPLTLMINKSGLFSLHASRENIKV